MIKKLKIHANSKNGKLLLFNKPYNVLAQFTDELGRKTLKDFIQVSGVYPAGRLDRDSEGLLILTNNGKLQARIANPMFKLPKTYWVQVEGKASEQQLLQLQKGIMLKDGLTLPAEVNVIAELDLWPRNPPIRSRKTIPTSWLSLTIRKGRNRQVRLMTAAVGLTTLRLVRVSIGSWKLDDLTVGEWRKEAAIFPVSN